MKKLSYLLLMIVALISCSEDKIQIEVSKITLDKTQETIMVGEQLSLTAKVEPAEITNVALSWSSSDEEVATVENGKVTGVAAGEAIISVVAPNGVKASCDIVVKTDDSGNDNLVDLGFEPYSTDAKLVQFVDNLFKWSVVFADKTAYDNFNYYYSDGSLLTLEFYSAQSNFAKGIPTGEFRVAKMSDSDADGIVRIKKTDNVTMVDEFLPEGSVTVTKEGDVYIYSVNASNAVYVFEQEVVVNTADTKLFTITNGAYNSTITGDINFSSEYNKAVYYNGSYGAELYIAGGEAQISPDGIITGAGRAIQIYRNTNFVDYPKDQYNLAGSFAIDKNVYGPNVIEPGQYKWGTTSGSWLWSQDADGNKSEMAPLSSGEVVIELNDEKNHIKVSITAIDDAKPNGNNVIVVYEGECLYFDPSQTGDFGACAAGYYGPFEFDSENMNWNIKLLSNEFQQSGAFYGGTGKVLMFDLLSIPGVRYNDGLNDGTYHFDNSGTLGEYTIQLAELWTYEGGNISNENVAINEGSLTIEKINDGTNRYNITVNVVDQKGQSHTGTYSGGINYENVATPPMKNRVFNGEGADVIFTYIGEDSFGRSNWGIEMYEATATRENGDDANGLILSFDIFVDGGQTFDKGMPTGKFDLYQPEVDPDYGFEINSQDKRGLSNGYYTSFYIVFQGDTGSPRGWTDGSVTVSKDDNGLYSINVDMESVYSSPSTGNMYQYTLDGDFTGETSTVERGSYPSAGRKANNAKKVAPGFSKTAK